MTKLRLKEFSKRPNLKTDSVIESQLKRVDNYPIFLTKYIQTNDLYI